jgi:hypothetical protein
MIEISNVTGLVITNIAFLMLRSCLRHKLTFDYSNGKDQLPNTETVAALKPLINSFNSVWIPWFVAITVDTYWRTWFMRSIYAVASINAFFSTILIFVHWQKGPQWYTRISPYFFYGMTMFAYLISPIYMVILLGYLVIWMQSRRWYSSIYFLYFLFIYLFRIGEYFARVKPLVNEILLTIKLQKEFQEFTDDELRAELRVCQILQKDDPNFENRVRIKLLKIMLEERVPYLEQPRPYGSGETRIGDIVKLEEDIFSLAYSVMIQDIFIFKQLDIVRG